MCIRDRVRGRVKSVTSILEKMQRKHIPMERMEEEVEDIAGIRIICQFEEDIDTVAALIQKRSDMKIKSEKNYLKHIKQSGYRSYHLIIYYTVETVEGPKTLQAEIQIRTMAVSYTHLGYCFFNNQSGICICKLYDHEGSCPLWR